MRSVGLPDRAASDIRRVARGYGVGKLVLFGSRAKGTNGAKSDIDLAVYGCEDLQGSPRALEEEVWTLLKFDVVDMDTVPPALAAEIEREGVALYEKIRRLQDAHERSQAFEGTGYRQ